MCGAMAITALNTAVNIASEGVAAKAKDIEAQHAWGSAQSDLDQKYNAIQLRENQEMQKTQLQTFQATQAGVSSTSRIRAQLAGGGVAGASAAERAAQPGIAATNFGATARINLANELRQNQADAASYRNKAQSIINENQPESGAALALQVGGTLLSAVGSMAGGMGGGGGGGGAGEAAAQANGAIADEVGRAGGGDAALAKAPLFGAQGLQADSEENFTQMLPQMMSQ